MLCSLCLEFDTQSQGGCGVGAGLRGMGTTENREERDQTGHEEQAERCERWRGLLWTPRQRREGPGSSGGGQLLPAARVLPASRALRSPTPRSPPGGAGARALSSSPWPLGQRPPSTPTAGLLTCGPERATGPGPGLAGSREELFSRASCSHGSAERGRAAAPSAAAKLWGADSEAPGGSGAQRWGAQGRLRA